jgi:hypothetical protein
MYTLKPNQENFTVVDGPLAGSSYKRGKLYKEIPPQEAHRFDDVSAPYKRPAPAAVPAAPLVQIKTAKARKRIIAE